MRNSYKYIVAKYMTRVTLDSRESKSLFMSLLHQDYFNKRTIFSKFSAFAFWISCFISEEEAGLKALEQWHVFFLLIWFLIQNGC